MKVAVLTSSRADYGIYLPLLKAMRDDPFFDLRLIVFGTHLSSFHGYTKSSIEQDNFRIDYEIDHVLASDSPQAIATSMAIVSMKFADIWSRPDKYDLVICLGDRYEMFAAVSAGVPFGIRFAHLHGGETTLGAIDNVFRHSITLFSALHLVATDSYAERVASIIGSSSNIYTVGALSLDNLGKIDLLDFEEFNHRFHIDLSKKTILVTYHPGTVNISENERYALELNKSLVGIGEEFQIIITMPNADTTGNSLRRVYHELQQQRPGVFLVENFGTQGYFTCLKHAAIVVGNSSSGIIEAASFEKFVVNIGDRQKGRAVSENIIQADPDAASITRACRKALGAGKFTGVNIYYRPDVAKSIIKILKSRSV